jgi:hypothetical protein
MKILIDAFMQFPVGIVSLTIDTAGRLKFEKDIKFP